MQKIRHRSGRRIPRFLPAVIAAGILLLTGLTAFLALSGGRQPIDLGPEPEYGGVLLRKEINEIASVSVRFPDGDGWHAVVRDGVLTVDDAEPYPVTPAFRDEILMAASIVTYEQILSEDQEEYRENLTDFGLGSQASVVTYTYTDGSSICLRIGTEYGDGTVFMTIDGEPGLYALNKGTAESLLIEKYILRQVEQPVIHKARIAGIRLTEPDGSEVAWKLDGAITDSDAGDRWFMEEPLRYPADPERMDKLRENLANIRLGAYVGEATTENRTRYGFDAACFTITVDQQEGEIGIVDDTGFFDTADYAADTFTLTVGGRQNDYVDYVLWQDQIYLMSHFTLAVFTELEPRTTLTRYTVPVALGNLASLTVETAGHTVSWTLERREVVLPNNELATDENGQVLTDVLCRVNGQDASYERFAAAYNDLLTVSVSAYLPENAQLADEPSMVFTFETIAGERHVLALIPCDAFHDAVVLDGEAVYCLNRGGMRTSLSEAEAAEDDTSITESGKEVTRP